MRSRMLARGSRSGSAMVTEPRANLYRLTRGQAVRAGAVLLVVVIGVLVAVVRPQRILHDSPSAPAWSARGAPCRTQPLLHVHDPSRLVVVAGCSTVSGVVRNVRYRSSDGDWQLMISVDKQFERYLRPANHGLLAVEVIPPDVPSVTLPSLGSHATFFGAWTLNRNQRRAAEMLPAWRIAADSGSVANAKVDPSRTGRLGVSVAVPAQVAVGGEFAVRVTANVTQHGKILAASQVHLFVEITDAAGRGVRWKAGSTNSLGVASLDLLALQVPGEFGVHLYASKLGQGMTVTKTVAVRRR